MRSRRTFRRRPRKKYDMQSVKFCQQSLAFPLAGAATCDDPAVTLFTLIEGDLRITQPAINPSNIITGLESSRGMSFGGLTADMMWTLNPADAPSGVANQFTHFLYCWECIYVASLDELGFVTYVPTLSSPSKGADHDVDVLWKRVSFCPYWGTGACDSACANQMSAFQGQNPDHIRIKTKRFLKEKQALVYAVPFTADNTIQTNIDVRVVLNGWMRVAVRNVG